VSSGSTRIGVFGGTFDPPHLGHLVVAVNVRHALALDRVLFVVANEPWQKVDERRVSPAEHRLALVEAAVDGVEGVEASRIELDRGGPSYSADTLRELRTTDASADLFLVLGYDAAVSIPTWERADELGSLATLVVVDRPGSDGEALPEGYRWVRVEAPRLEISSTDLRERVAEGRPLDFLVPDAVIACIDRLGLYRDGRDG
jgi:nicotinate-nucleotide adenylyltransferase